MYKCAQLVVFWSSVCHNFTVIIGMLASTNSVGNLELKITLFDM